MRNFKPVKQATRFLSVPLSVHNLFNLRGHLVTAEQYSNLGGEYAFWIDSGYRLNAATGFLLLEKVQLRAPKNMQHNVINDNDYEFFIIKI